MLATMLAVAVPCSEGNQRIVYVSKLISDHEDFFTNDEDDNIHICCVYGNCTCNSLDHALANLTSNVVINITTDVMLSSLVKVSDLQNASIIGHNNPTVNCTTVGIHFTFCHDCFIRSVTWDGCGTTISDNYTEPGIKLNHSSNLTIQNCSFQHSIGQALVLSEMSGDVNINNCKFANNSHYRGHGVAIYYSYMYNARKSSNDQFVFVINNCSFTNNKHNKSLVYIKNRLFSYHKIIFKNFIFSSNQGISVYVINHKIYINGKVLFQKNVGEDGAGIYISDHSTVVFDVNSNVTFYLNFADFRGAAVFLTNYSICLFDSNSIVTFNYNRATKGGAIYSEANSNVTFNGVYKVIFTSNSATQDGAAIYSVGNSHIIYTSTTANSSELLYNRTQQTAANHNNDCISNFHNICFKENFNTAFCNNTANYGGAIFCENNCYISFENASTAVFINNNAYVNGGAIHCNNNSCVSFKGNSTTVFGNNTANLLGGAISSFLNINISFEGNSVTEFSENAASYGGAMQCYFNSYTSFKRNSVTIFSNNTANYGGALHSYNNSHVSFEGNSFTRFIDNTVGLDGGAIGSNNHCYVLFQGNSSTVFCNNNADNCGGAMISYGNSYISFEGNSVTEFCGNTAVDGGAMQSYQYCYMYLKEILLQCLVIILLIM